MPSRKAGEPEHYDSANIAESYAGIVLPLTATYARHVYEATYRDLLHASGVSYAKLDRHAEVFRGLVATVRGRMYYRMNHWYLMTAFIPGYRRNKRNFERMITSNVRAAVDAGIRPSFLLSLAYPFIALWKTLTAGAASRKFMRETRATLEEIDARSFDALSYAECLALFATLEKRLLRRWFVTVENDFLLMTCLGTLAALQGETGLDARLRFKAKAGEQLAALSALSEAAYAHEGLARALAAADVDAFVREASSVPEFMSARDAYLREYGGRFANELKLETVGLDEDPAELMRLLRAYRGYKPPRYQERKETHGGALARFVEGQLRVYAKRREDARLLRSRSFAVVRRLARRMGLLLAASGALTRGEDVFYLEFSELMREDVPGDRSLAAKAGARREEYAAYARMSMPAHFSSVDGLPPPLKEEKPNALRARPASPGVVRGRARVMKEFRMPEDGEKRILVAPHTDPGWTALIALSTGLIVEHGGTLSHASIVARELGIPAVIGATGATDLLKDGEEVEIDGATGAIRRLNERVV